MTEMMKQATEDAKTLGITPREALVFAFAAQAALAKMGRNVKAQAAMHVGGRHAAGNMDIATMRQCLGVIGF